MNNDSYKLICMTSVRQRRRKKISRKIQEMKNRCEIGIKKKIAIENVRHKPIQAHNQTDTHPLIYIHLFN